MEWTEVDLFGLNKTKVDRMDQIRPNGLKWTEYDRSGMTRTE